MQHELYKKGFVQLCEVNLVYEMSTLALKSMRELWLFIVSARLPNAAESIRSHFAHGSVAMGC
ncbi:hypothetical protein EMIT091MI3_20231 [Kosakonia quasisacchari]